MCVVVAPQSSLQALLVIMREDAQKGGWDCTQSDHKRGLVPGNLFAKRQWILRSSFSDELQEEKGVITVVGVTRLSKSGDKKGGVREGGVTLHLGSQPTKEWIEYGMRGPLRINKECMTTLFYRLDCNPTLLKPAMEQLVQLKKDECCPISMDDVDGITHGAKDPLWKIADALLRRDKTRLSTLLQSANQKEDLYTVAYGLNAQVQRWLIAYAQYKREEKPSLPSFVMKILLQWTQGGLLTLLDRIDALMLQSRLCSSILSNVETLEALLLSSMENAS